MADLTVTATQVLPTTSTTIERGTAAEAITAGQVVFLDPATGTVKLFDANDATRNTEAPAIALNGAAAGQPVTYATGGSITIGAGAAPTAGVLYVASATAGGIAPSADLTTGWKAVFLGVGDATNTLKLRPWNSAVSR